MKNSIPLKITIISFIGFLCYSKVEKNDILWVSLQDGNQEICEGSRTLASLYNLIKEDSSKSVNSIDGLNIAFILSKDNHVGHWLNNVKGLEQERDNFLKLVSESKHAKWLNFGTLKKGEILLHEQVPSIL
jgi:hypothetical protein